MSGLDAFLASLRERGVRLWVEGDRLKLRAPNGVLEPALTAAISQRKAEILALLRPAPVAEITPVPAQDSYPVSAAQRRLWVLAQFPAAATAYNIPLHQELEGPLDRAAFDAAVAGAVERHQSLRTTFAVIDGEPRQVVHGRLAVPVDFRDLSRHEDAAALVRTLGQRHAGAPFDLTAGPLLRVALLRLAPRRHVLLLTISHLIADGVSLGVLARDLSRLYLAAAQGQPDDLPALGFGYPAFAAWQERLLAGEAMAPHRAFWHAELGGAIPVLELPTDFARPPVPNFRGGELSFTLEPALLEAAQAFCTRRNASLFMFLHATLKALLFAYSGQDDITIGCAVAGRDQAALADQVGLYLNTLALRSRLDGAQSFERFFAEIVEATKQAFDHRDYPFDRLVDELAIARDPSRSPLFDVMLVLQNQDEPGLGLDGIRAHPVFEHPGTSKFDLTFSFKASPVGLVLGIEYSTDLFRAARIRRMGGHVRTLIGSILENPAEAIGRLNILPPEEAQALNAFAGPVAASDAEATVVAHFERFAAAAPDRIALVRPAEADPDRAEPGRPKSDRIESDRAEPDWAEAGRATMSYGELNRRANSLAHRLRELGVATGRLAAIYLEPSLNTVVAILGVLKAGGAYVPLDTRHPAERIRFILDDCSPDVVITRGDLAAGLPETSARQVWLDRDGDPAATDEARNPADRAGPGDLAYVIYTSGSTGRPKGVLVTHRNVARLFSATEDWFRFGPDDVWTLFHSYAFDFSVWELWGALLFGGRLGRTVALDDPVAGGVPPAARRRTRDRAQPDAVGIPPARRVGRPGAHPAAARAALGDLRRRGPRLRRAAPVGRAPRRQPAAAGQHVRDHRDHRARHLAPDHRGGPRRTRQPDRPTDPRPWDSAARPADAARSDRRARRDLRARRRRGGRLSEPARTDRAALRARSLRRPMRVCTGRAISAATAMTAISNISAGSTASCRSAATGSSRARSRRHWPAIRVSPRRWWTCAAIRIPTGTPTGASWPGMSRRHTARWRPPNCAAGSGFACPTT